MSKKHKKLLDAIFKDPVSRNTEWRKIETLLLSLDCEKIEGSGSRVAFKRGTVRADFYRLHPGKEAKPYQIRAVLDFFNKLEIKP